MQCPVCGQVRKTEEAVNKCLMNHQRFRMKAEENRGKPKKNGNGKEVKSLNFKKLLFFVLLVTSLATTAVAVNYYYQKSVELTWVVVENEGLEVSCEGIMFGSIARGSSKTAEFWVKNVAETPLNVSIYPILATLELYPCEIIVAPQNFILDVNQTQTVAVTIVVPYNATLGERYNVLVIKAYPL